MVFGNMGNDCATGVAFSRNPGNGENAFYGEYLVNAQGEDVVAGIRTPAPINKYSQSEYNKHLTTLEEAMPEIYKELVCYRNRLERHYRDMQDIEFTIEKAASLYSSAVLENATALLRFAWLLTWLMNGSALKKRRLCALRLRNSTNFFTRLLTLKPKKTQRSLQKVCLLGREAPAARLFHCK